MAKVNEKKYKVLILDDEPFILLTVSACLKGNDYDITTAENVETALEAFKQKHFDVILSDIMMDSVDGFKFRDIIRSYDKRIPIIFLTSLLDNIDSSLLTRIMRDNYSYYLNKNFTRDTLREKLELVLQAYQAQNEILQLQKHMNNDLDLATRVQTAMLPPWVHFDPNYQFSFLYHPLFKVSGDLFEWIPMDKNHAMGVFGDISGHGIHSALTMTAVQSMLKQMVHRCTPDTIRPNLILQKMNDFFCDKLQMCSYMTCLAAIWDFANNTVLFHSAGHPDLLCFDSKTGEQLIPNPKHRGSLPVGMVRNAQYPDSDNVLFHFPDSAVFLAHTDGLWDINSGGDADGIDPEIFLKLAATAVKDGELATIPDKLIGALEQIGYDVPSDDVSLFALKKTLKENSETEHFLQVISDAGIIDSATIQAADFVLKTTGDDFLAANVEILLSEFLINIVKHGLKDYQPENALIAVILRIEEKRVKITVLDRGRAWDSEHFKGNQDVDAMLNELSQKKTESGRGIPLILKISPQINRMRYCGINETIFYVSKDISMKLLEGKSE